MVIQECGEAMKLEPHDKTIIEFVVRQLERRGCYCEQLVNELERNLYS